MKKILLVGLHDDDNLGDTIISDCTIALLKQRVDDVDIERLSFNKKDKLIRNNLFVYFLCRCLERISLYFGGFHKLKHCLEWKYLTLLLEKTMPRFDAIIIGGGGLIKHKHQFFGTVMLAVTKYAENLQIPIFYNSVGVEGFEDNWKCDVLIQCLNSPVVKLISTRDDIDTLRNCYIEKNDMDKTMAICDPAVWASEVYAIKRENRPIDVKRTIGINISYENLFYNYGINLNASQHYELMYEIVTHLNNQYNLTLYTNGGYADNAFLLRLHKQLCEEGVNVLHDIPHNAIDLVRIISKFDCILATRLHSVIVAYSLNIPSVPMEWNNKVRFFCNATHNDMFIEKDHFECNYIVGKLNQAITRNYDQTLRNEYRETIMKFMQRINI